MHFGCCNPTFFFALATRHHLYFGEYPFNIVKNSICSQWIQSWFAAQIQPLRIQISFLRVEVWINISLCYWNNVSVIKSQFFATNLIIELCRSLHLFQSGGVWTAETSQRHHSASEPFSLLLSHLSGFRKPDCFVPSERAAKANKMQSL